MALQEPLEKEEFQTPKEPARPVEPRAHDHTMHHSDGLIEPKIKEYLPVEVGIVVFTIVTLIIIFIGITSDMWGLMN